MRVSCVVVESELVVVVVNRGDEAAQNVSTEIVFLDRTHRSTTQEKLAPNQSMTVSFPLDSRDLSGSYPAIITVHFEDLNAYPFSSVTVHPVSFDATHVPRILGRLKGGVLRTKRNLDLHIWNHSPEAISARCRVVVARELVATVPEEVVTVPGNGTRTVKIPLENFSVLPGSTYPAHALLEYDENGEHFCALASTTVKVERPLPFSFWGFWVLLLLAAGGVGLAMRHSRTE